MLMEYCGDNDFGYQTPLMMMLLVEMEMGVKKGMEGKMVVMVTELLIECVSAVMEGRWRNWIMVLSMLLLDFFQVY